MPNFYNGIELLREVDSTWHHVNGTVPWSEHDEAGRLVAALAWKYNSCAVDAVFVAALLLNSLKRLNPRVTTTRSLITEEKSVGADETRQKSAGAEEQESKGGAEKSKVKLTPDAAKQQIFNLVAGYKVQKKKGDDEFEDIDETPSKKLKTVEEPAM